MANSYTLFSVRIDKLSEAQKEWLKEQLVPGEDIEDRDAKEAEALCENWGLDEPHEWPSFDYAFRDDKVWFHDDGGGGNPDHVARLICEFLKTFKTQRPDEAVGFEVAYTCDKPRPGEFGGAAYWCTAHGFEVFGTIDWIQERVKWTEEARMLEKPDDLYDLYGVDNFEEFKKQVYKATSCGAWVRVDEKEVFLGSIVEGHDLEPTFHKFFPFNVGAWRQMVQDLEETVDEFLGEVKK